MIECWQRCAACGRRTPHETCHEHSLVMGKAWPRDYGAAWNQGFNQEPEECDDPDCPELVFEIGPVHPKWADLPLPEISVS